MCEKENIETSETICVRRQWNDYRIAEYEIDKIHDLHWSQVSGGVGSRAPRIFLHGYVSCDEMISGELAHSCRHGQGPHPIKICITKKDNDPKTYSKLKEMADNQ